MLDRDAFGDRGEKGIWRSSPMRKRCPDLRGAIERGNWHPLRRLRRAPRFSLHRRVTVLFLGMLVLSCATEFPPYEPRPLDTYPQRQVSKGLWLAIEPLRDSSLVEKHFGVDLGAFGVLPVFVLAENRSETSSVILGPETFRLGESRTSEIRHPDRSATDNTWAATVGACMPSHLAMSPVG